MKISNITAQSKPAATIAPCTNVLAASLGSILSRSSMYFADFDSNASFSKTSAFIDISKVKMKKKTLPS